MTVIVKDEFSVKTNLGKEGFALKCFDIAAGLESLWMKGQKFWTSVTRQRMPSALQTIKLRIGGGVQWKRVRIFSTLSFFFYSVLS